MNKSNNKSSKRSISKNKTAPEIRDNLDSRKNVEQDFKGDDVTHNRKPHHNKPHGKK